MSSNPNLNTTIRAAQSQDLEMIMTLSKASGLFEPPELEEVRSMLSAWFAGELGEGHQWLVCETDDIVGVAYFAPEQMSYSAWNLYMIAIHPNCQGQGIGGRLIRHVEQVLREGDAYILLVETSGLESFEQTREFYRKHGFEQEARIRDFYRAGEDKIVFRKQL